MPRGLIASRPCAGQWVRTRREPARRARCRPWQRRRRPSDPRRRRSISSPRSCTRCSAARTRRRCAGTRDTARPLRETFRPGRRRGHRALRLAAQVPQRWGPRAGSSRRSSAALRPECSTTVARDDAARALRAKSRDQYGRRNASAEDTANARRNQEWGRVRRFSLYIASSARAMNASRSWSSG